MNPTQSYRWFYVQQNLQVKENVPKVQELLKRAKAAGYNGMVLADYKLSILDRVPDYYFTNLAEVKKTAEALGIALYPTVCSCGYDNGLLAHDPNLAEGLPVREAIFTVTGREANVVAENLLPGGGFEELKGAAFAQWDWNDPAARDTAVKHRGEAALRFENPMGNARVSKRIACAPFRQFHLSVWIKTENFPANGEIHCTVLTGNGKPSLCHNTWSVKPTQHWTEYHAVFNSLQNTSFQLYLGAWGATTGRLWLDDARLEEVGFLNLVRRSGCPLVVKGEDGTVYTEGRDFEPVKDPRMGSVPWDGGYEVWHAPPPLRLTAGSRIKDGQRLKVSFFHTVVVYDEQVSASLVDPKVFAIHKDLLQRTEKALHPKGLFFSHDELRVANWGGEALALNKTAGQLLATHVQKCVALARQASPQAELFVWSDMFDPFHNAQKDYYLVRGSLEGSWEGLPKDMLVVNWNSGKPKESLGFFAQRGHRQVLAGYYDGNPEKIKDWLAAAKSLGGANVVGSMYTTWRGDYTNLEAYAKAAWG